MDQVDQVDLEKGGQDGSEGRPRKTKFDTRRRRQYGGPPAGGRIGMQSHDREWAEQANHQW